MTYRLFELSILNYRFFFSFRTLNISSHKLLMCKVSAEKSIGSLLGFPCVKLFSFSPFKILSLSLLFTIFITMCLGVGFFGLIFLRALSTSWTYYFSNKFSAPFSLFSSSGISIMLMLLHFILLLSSLSTLILHIYFFPSSAQLAYFPLFCPPGHSCILC